MEIREVTETDSSTTVVVARSTRSAERWVGLAVVWAIFSLTVLDTLRTSLASLLTLLATVLALSLVAVGVELFLAVRAWRALQRPVELRITVDKTRGTVVLGSRRLRPFRTDETTVPLAAITRVWLRRNIRRFGDSRTLLDRVLTFLQGGSYPGWQWETDIGEIGLDVSSWSVSICRESNPNGYHEESFFEECQQVADVLAKAIGRELDVIDLVPPLPLRRPWERRAGQR